MMINWLQSMELLLNLVWVTLALIALCAFVRGRRSHTLAAQVPYQKALLALACILVLLFPIVSASDDLHPTQALLEDATKRIHRLVAPLQHAQGVAPAGLLPAVVLSLLCSMVALHLRQPDAGTARELVRERMPRDGRAPPTL